jgi:hypothetical protein
MTGGDGVEVEVGGTSVLVKTISVKGIDVAGASVLDSTISVKTKLLVGPTTVVGTTEVSAGPVGRAVPLKTPVSVGCSGANDTSSVVKNPPAEEKDESKEL